MGDRRSWHSIVVNEIGRIVLRYGGLDSRAGKYGSWPLNPVEEISADSSNSEKWVNASTGAAFGDISAWKVRQI